ncbi:hypothetical protein MSKU9_1929 [Komagataeibacter diospyri]|uniref:Uncharacterized protein n=1 Tax=Komagataeibacter diospyri TaxID=1932662 RepID=A0A4P5NQ69_9PROT|nr:hypothetical protein MSKU9_1929 [Komagataeibacter diospyri]
MNDNWRSGLEVWFEPFLAALGRKASRRMRPTLWAMPRPVETFQFTSHKVFPNVFPGYSIGDITVVIKLKNL